MGTQTRTCFECAKWVPNPPPDQDNGTCRNRSPEPLLEGEGDPKKPAAWWPEVHKDEVACFEFVADAWHHR